MLRAYTHFFNTIGKQLDESPKSRRINDVYFIRLKELSTIPQLAARLRFMIRDVLDLRSNNWIPRREEIKGKTITEIHSEAEKNLGLRPGATASMRNPRNLPGGQGNIGPSGYPVNRPGTGGMMPGMPGTRKLPGMPGMPGVDNDNWEVPRGRSMPRGGGGGRLQSPLIDKSTPLKSKLLPQGSGGFVSGKTSALLQGSGPPAPARQPSFGLRADPVGQVPRPSPDPTPICERPVSPATSNMKPEELKRKTISLEEYFGIRLLDEALQCMQELKSPSYHSEIVKEAINLGLEKNPPCVVPIAKLFEHLLAKNVFTAREIGTGCLLYASMIDDNVIDLPKAPNNFGEIMGKLVLAGGVDFNVVKEVLKKVEDEMFRKPIFDAVVKVATSGSSGQGLLDAQASDVEACRGVV